MKKTGKVILWILAGLLSMIVATVLLIRLPSVQNYITHKATDYVSSKTHTKVELQRLYIGFPKLIVLEGLYAEDLNSDTLIYLGQLEIDIDMMELFNKKIAINDLLIANLNTHIKRNLPDSTYNFNFFITAFSNPSAKKPLPSDTASSPLEIQVNSIELKNINATYSDKVSGINMLTAIGGMTLNMKYMDISNMVFNGDNLTISDANISIIKDKFLPETPIDTTTSKLPTLAMNKIKLNHVQFYYEDKISGMLVNANAGNLLLKPEIIDFNGMQIKIHELELNESTTLVAINGNNKKQDLPAISPPTQNTGWKISTTKILADKVNFRFDIKDVPKQLNGMDYSHLNFTNVKLDIKDVFYSPEKISANIKHVSLHEQCGLELKKLSAKAAYDDQHAALINLSLITANSNISNYIRATYNSINHIEKHIGEIGINANFRDCKIALDDILLFAPTLKNTTPFNGKKGKKIFVDGKIDGPLKNIYAKNLIVRAEQLTSIALDAHIIGLPNAQKAVYDINIKSFVTKKTDVLALIPQKMLPVNIPSVVKLKGTFNGAFTNFKTNLFIETTSGDLHLNANMKKVSADTNYALNLSTKQLDLGYLLNQPDKLGPVTLNTTIKGKNFSPSNLQAEIVTKINSIELNKYRYQNIDLNAEANKNQYTATMLINDSNIKMDLKTTISMVEKQETVKLDLNLEGADLKKLKLSNDNIRTGGHLNIDLAGKKMENFTGHISLNKVMVIKDNKNYRIDSFLVATVNNKKHSSLKMKSGFINVDYEGTVTLVNLKTALTKHLNTYFSVDTLKRLAIRDTSEQDFKLAVKVFPNPLLNEVLFPKLEKFNGANFAVDFSNVKQKLNVTILAPVMQYNGTKINDLKVEIHSDKNAMNYALDLSSFGSGSIHLPKINFAGNLQKNVIVFALHINDKDSGNKLLIAGNIKEREADKKYFLRIDQNPVFNNQKWKIPENNFISFSSKGLFVNEFVLNRAEQTLAISSDGKDESAPLKILFKQFELGTLSQVAERDTAIIRGMMNGTFEVRNLNKSPAFVSNLTISNIVYLQNPIGNLHIKADNLTANKYTANIVLSGMNNDAKIQGSYFSTDNGKIDFSIDLNKLNLKSIESFTGGQIRNSSGYLTGNVRITGTGSKPLINGDIGIKEAGFNVAYVNNYFKIKENHIKIDSEGIYFKSFNLLDSAGQKAIIDGSVFTTDFVKMKFDINVKTNNFTILNTTIKDNPLYFGRIQLNSTISIKGNENLPVINAQIKLLSGSNISVIVPSSQLSIDKGEGVVVLINASPTNNLMGRIDSVHIGSVIKGIDLSANIEIDRQTKFKVIVDRVSGDSLVVKGEGILSFSIDPSGKQSLTGNYILTDGSYNASFQKVIKRDFKIKPGSIISWNGSPLDATVDITAIYQTRTSPADLLSNELAGSSVSEKNAYRKLLLFNVNMMMNGPLLKPEISFLIDMQDKDKNAFGGIVYSKVNSLNNDPSELNKQVFSLLILNEFIPTGTTSSSDGSVVNTIARNSVNQALSDQLNHLSGKYVKGVELNFDIQSNDEYAGNTVKQNTAVQVGLKKEFLNNRISVQVGSNINVLNNGSTSTNASSLTGDMVVEYKITDDGSFRFKAFRENQYEGIIDGLLYKTGVGIMYTRDFDTLKDLRSSPKKEEDIKVEEKK